MKKRFSAVVAAILIVLFVSVIGASAGVSDNPRVVDKADVLTSAQEADLESKLSEYSKKQNADIVIVTVPDLKGESFSFNGSVEDFADMFYETNGYDADGAMILITLDNGYGSRRVQYSCSGKCMKRLTEDEQNAIIDDVYYSLKNGDYYSALNTMAYETDDKLTPKVGFLSLLIAIGIGFAVSMIIMLIIRGKLKTVSMQRGAASYIRPGSMNVRVSRDTFLYSTVTKTARETGSSGGSGRTSSGGGSHSGVGRNF